MHFFLAIDIGAESGRMILGCLEDEKLQLKEIHRFINGMLQIQGKFYWNIGQLYKEILDGIEICIQQEKVQPESIGIDTWGVDYGLLASDGTLMGLPYAYRDPRTENAIEEFTGLFSREKIYKITGNLFAPYNTLFQLYAAKKYHPVLLNAASDLLFMPDLLAYMLTGEKKTDFTFASTSQLYNPGKNTWAHELFTALGISVNIMQEIVEPGTVIGYLSDDICKRTGISKIPLIAVATHDTNSAISAIPAVSEDWAFISSGTWSLMGFESETPVINDKAYQLNFSNEGGVSHTFDVLKNHMGLWLLQQCRHSWRKMDYTFGSMVHLAVAAKPFLAHIDIDNMLFLNPPDMPSAINEFLKITNQASIGDHGQIIRVIIESLALKYAETFEQIGELRGKKPQQIYITGGGINNELLCQYTANATGVTVKTGLAEGSSAGNIMVQAMGKGYVDSLQKIREVISGSFESKSYFPEDVSIWQEKASEYPSVIGRKD